MVSIDNKKIEELLTRGVTEVIELESLKKRLQSGKQLRVKLGIDPTSPNIHLGRSIPLLKLRDFQELGHKVVFIIGDFTGVIGDTSDKESERPMLAEEQVKINMKNYIQQAGKVIDIEKCEIHYNSEWLGKLDYHEIGRQADVFSLNEFISRENISERLEEGKRISLRELLYPLMQGFDSVAIKADVEIGGTDQRFNLLAGRGLQQYYKQPAQDIITNPLIEGLDGRKMSSSWGNTINLLDSPDEMYGKVMSLKDELIVRYFVLATRVDLAEIEEMKKELLLGRNPKELKELLAFEIVKMYHSELDAMRAHENFRKIFHEKILPDEMLEIKPTKYDLVSVLVESKFCSSKMEARRVITQGGVKVNEQKVSDEKLELKAGDVVQKGPRFFLRIK